MRLRRRLSGSSEGAVLLELAVCLPILFSLVLGIITGGEAYFRKVGVNDAVRVGARFGASLAMGTGPTALSDWTTAVQGQVVAASGGQLTTSDVCVAWVLPSGGTDCGVADPAGASLESTIHVVKVSASKGVQLQFLFFTETATMKARVASRYERDSG